MFLVMSKSNHSLLEDKYYACLPPAKPWNPFPEKSPVVEDLLKILKTNKYQSFYDETDSQITIEVVAPGLKKEDFNISLNGEMLTISYEVKKENKASKFLSSRNESWLVPKEVIPENISASYDAGVLVVVIKKEEPKKIPVTTIKVE